jgi:hypothetical protein
MFLPLQGIFTVLAVNLPKTKRTLTTIHGTIAYDGASFEVAEIAGI